MTDDNHSMCHFYCNFSVFPHIITVSILRNTHCMSYGLIVILPPHNNQTE